MKTKSFIITSIVIAILFILAFYSKVNAATTTNILFIGNSSTYYNDMPKMVKGLANADGMSCNVDAVTASNYNLTKFSTTTNSYYKKIVKAINSKTYDYVVLQDHRENVIESLSNSKKAIKALNALMQGKKSKVILYETQADKISKAFLINNHNVTLSHSDIDYYLLRNYSYIGNKYSLPVAACGINYTRFNTLFPTTELYNSDNIHPKVAGSYLAACTLYQTIFGKSAFGNAFLPGSTYDTSKLLDSMSVEKAVNLQNVSDPTLAFSKKVLKINVGKKTSTSATLKYTIGNPTMNNINKTITYFSTNDTICSVNKNTCEVTGVSPGEAMVMATNDSGLYSFCNVTVLLPSTSISINEKGPISMTKGKTQKLTYKLVPQKSTDSVTWKSSNNKVASVSSNGVVKALKLGTCTITATTTSGKKATRKIKVKLVTPTKLKISVKKPTNCKAKYKNLKITWKKNKNAVKYYVFRKKQNSSYKKIATVKTNSFVNKNVRRNRTFSYKIQSVYSNSSSNSAKSKAKSIYVK